MRILKLALLLSIGAFLFVTSAAEAQRITAGGGVGYGSKSENLNFSVNAYYRLPTLPLRIGGDVGYSKPGDDINEFDGNLNLHFLAVDTELVTLYTITGLNVVHTRFSANDETITDTGFNLGAGAELDLGFGRGFGEAKYIIGSERDEQWVFGVGVRVSVSN